MVYVLLYVTKIAEKIVLIRKSLTVNDFYRPRYEVVSIEDKFCSGCFNSIITRYGQGFSEPVARNAAAMNFISKTNTDIRKDTGISLSPETHCRN